MRRLAPLLVLAIAPAAHADYVVDFDDVTGGSGFTTPGTYTAPDGVVVTGGQVLASPDAPSGPNYYGTTTTGDFTDAIDIRFPAVQSVITFTFQPLLGQPAPFLGMTLMIFGQRARGELLDPGFGRNTDPAHAAGLTSTYETNSPGSVAFDEVIIAAPLPRFMGPFALDSLSTSFVVPEPPAWVLAGLGAGVLGLWRRAA